MNVSRAAPAIETLLERGTWTGIDDARLLERYARLGDRDAFEILAARHGPMVMGVCRRILVEPSDADDAFQATFLVLIRRARSLGPRDVLSAWLHGVATKIARRARMDRARRRSRERPGPAIEPGRESPSPDFALREAIDEEVERLPWKYRAPVALCYLEGLTHEEAASRLGWPVGSVKGRLARARSLLGPRLARRGVTAGAGALALENLASAAAPGPLAAAVATAAGRVAEGAAWSAVLSLPVVNLAKGARASMITVKLSVAALAASALAVTAGVGVAAARSGGPGQEAGPPPAVAHRPNATASKAASDEPVGPQGPHVQPKPDADARMEELMKRLDEPLMMGFSRDTPLEDVLKFIKQATQRPGYTGIPIYVDPIGLIEAEKTVTSPVTIEVEGVPLRRSLQLLLEQIDLVYYVADDGFLVITSEERARFGLPPDMARPSAAFREEIAKALRGDMDADDMEALARKIKLIDEIRRAVKPPEPPAGEGGGFQ